MSPPALRYASIADWRVISGMGRSATYLALGQGDLRAVKFGYRTLIDVEHGLALGSPRCRLQRSRRPITACGIGRSQTNITQQLPPAPQPLSPSKVSGQCRSSTAARTEVLSAAPRTTPETAHYAGISRQMRAISSLRRLGPQYLPLAGWDDRASKSPNPQSRSGTEAVRNSAQASIKPRRFCSRSPRC